MIRVKLSREAGICSAGTGLSRTVLDYTVVILYQ